MFDGCAERVTYGFDRYSVVNVVEETFDNHVHCLTAVNATGHAVEQLLLVDASGRGGV